MAGQCLYKEREHRGQAFAFTSPDKYCSQKSKFKQPNTFLKRATEESEGLEELLM